MTIELRVLTGARAGHRVTCDGPVVTIGRHPASDLQLDVHGDLEVSARHAELRVAPDGTVVLADLGSTNGTFVGGERVHHRTLADGDVVQLGGAGPRVEVRMIRRAAEGAAPGTGAAGSVSHGPSGPRRRAAYAAAATGLILLVVGVAYIAGGRGADARLRELRALGAADSPQAPAADEYAATREGISPGRDTAALAALDLAALNARNAPAVAYLVAEHAGRVVAGTAFAISADGAMLTNRHLVHGADGRPASRVAVKFRGARDWRAVRVVRVGRGENDDLALLRLVDGGTVPAVQGLAADDAALREGAPIVSIGYPLGRDTPMEGRDDDFVPRTSLYPGTISKTLPQVVQLAAWAGHGSSGSPILEPGGLVVGVVWGGPREGNGRLVYAVPASRVAAFLRGEE